MRENFHQQLEHLKDQLLTMALQVDRSVGDAVQAYLQNDLDLGQRVLGAELEIDRMERDIDRYSLELLAMEQPMAIDLRFILAVMRINSDLERVGDQASNIAERLHEVHRMARVDLPVDIAALGSHARRMLTLAMQAFREGDSVSAEAVLGMDDEIDQLARQAFSRLSKVISEQPAAAPQALNALRVTRILERVADHATNIAEDVIFWQRADDVRHNLHRQTE
jgi:phosphate transport system protein